MQHDKRKRNTRMPKEARGSNQVGCNEK